MSIIDDALKKTQNRMNQNTPPQAPAPQEKKPSKNRRTWLCRRNALIAGLLVTIGCAGALLWRHRSSLQALTPVITKATTPKPKTAAPRVVTIQPKTKPLPPPPSDNRTIVLNGTMMVGGQRVALINNNIYYDGDQIGEYTIQSIDMNRVTIATADGDTRVLRVGQQIKAEP